PAERAVGRHLGSVVDQLAKELVRFFESIFLEVKQSQLQVVAYTQISALAIRARVGILFHGPAQELLLLPLFGQDRFIPSGWESSGEGRRCARRATMQPSRRAATKQGQSSRRSYESCPPSPRTGRRERCCCRRWRGELE